MTKRQLRNKFIQVSLYLPYRFSNSNDWHNSHCWFSIILSIALSKLLKAFLFCHSFSWLTEQWRWRCWWRGWWSCSSSRRRRSAHRRRWLLVLRGKEARAYRQVRAMPVCSSNHSSLTRSTFIHSLLPLCCFSAVVRGAPPDLVLRLVEDPEFRYEDFAPRGEQSPPTMRAQVVWSISVCSRRFIFLDTHFQVTSSYCLQCAAC